MLTCQADNSQRISDYNILQPVQKAMVQIMAVNVDYCRLYALINCLTDLGLVNEKTGHAFTSATIGPLQKELIAKGLLLKSSRGICCPESIGRQAVYDTLLNDGFRQIAEVILKNMSVPDTGNLGKPFKNYQQLLRSFQIALFTNNSMAEIYILTSCGRQYFHDEYSANHLYLQILNHPFFPDIIEKIDPGIRRAVLGSLLNEAGCFLEPAMEMQQYIVNTYRSELSEKSERVPLIFYFLICGDIASARLFLNSLDDDLEPEHLSRRGWLECICGNYREALRFFNQDIQLLKKLTGKRKLFLQSYTGLFYLLTMLATGPIVSARSDR